MSRISRPQRPSRRVIAGIGAAVLLCLWGSYQFYVEETANQQQYPDAYTVAAQVKRLSPVLAIVPANTVLGYLTDLEPGSDVDSVIVNTAGFVLAPRLIDRAGAHEWVLGDFFRPADYDGIGRSKGLRMEWNFGNGVVLYRKAQ